MSDKFSRNPWHVYMNLFTRNSPYYHLLKYFLNTIVALTAQKLVLEADDNFNL